MRRLAVQGAGATLFAGGLILGLQVVGTIALARLLTPNDFGIVTMVTTLSLLLVNFGLNGFTEAIIQMKEMNNSLASNIFWINSGAGLLFSLCFAGSGTLLSQFYHEPLVAGVAIGISPSIFITSISVTHLALLKRAMNFSAASLNEVVSRSVALLVSIVLAWTGFRYWALVASVVAQPLVQLMVAVVQCRWIPIFPRRASGTASLVRFAFHVYGRFTVGYFSRNTDNLLVGWRLGTSAIGFYKKAYDLFALSASQLTSPLTNVAVAALSRFEPRSDQYRDHLLSSMKVTAFVGMGLSGVLTLIGKDLFRLLLGPAWAPAGQIFTVFAPGIGAMLVYYIHGWIHLSIGKPDRWFRWGIFEAIVTCMLFILALPWGPSGIAFAWTSSFWLLTLPSLWYAGRPIDLRIPPLVAALWKYVVASLFAGIAIAVAGSTLSFSFLALNTLQGAAARIAAGSLSFVVLYAAAVAALHRGFEPLRQLVRLSRQMISMRRLSESPRPLRQAPPIELPTNIFSTDLPKRPLVSILIPAFNAEEWIASSVRSALAQTWEPKEIIVVDDGSTDRTAEIARRFEPEGVRVVLQKNQGAAAARNHAYSLCRGDYIQWLDADDLLAPDKVAKQMEAVSQTRNERLLFSSAFARFKYRHLQAEFEPTVLWFDLSPVEWLIRKLGQNVFMQTATWLVSRELSEAAGPWNTELLGDDDGEYFCRVLLASDGVRFVPEAKVYYRAPWVGTLSHIAKSRRKLHAHWTSMQLHISYLLSLEDSPRVRSACLEYLQTCLIYFYPDHPDILSEVIKTAEKLNGRLSPPKLSWKYSWIGVFFGWQVAKHAQVFLPQIRWWFGKSWDKVLFRIQTYYSSTEL